MVRREPGTISERTSRMENLFRGLSRHFFDGKASMIHTFASLRNYAAWSNTWSHVPSIKVALRR
jgi:hypothetical protein